MAEWLTTIGSSLSSAFEWVGEREWAADMAAGAAGGALTYMAAREKQKHDEKLLKMKDSMEKVQWGGSGSSGGSHSTMTNGILSSDQDDRVKDYSKGF